MQISEEEAMCNTSVCRVSRGLCSDWRSIVFRLVSAHSFPRCLCPRGQVGISHDAVWFCMCEKRCRDWGGGQMTREMIQIGNIICLEFLKLGERGLFLFCFCFSSMHGWLHCSVCLGMPSRSLKKTTRVHLTQSLRTPPWFGVLSKHLEGLACLSSYQDLPKLGDG